MSLVDFTEPDNVYLVCGKTDMRKGIDGLAGIIRYEHGIELNANSLFLFCGRKRDRFKMLYWDGDGFLLLYKRVEDGNLQWPREDEVGIRRLTDQQLRWLFEGLSIDQKRVIHKSSIGQF